MRIDMDASASTSRATDGGCRSWNPAAVGGLLLFVPYLALPYARVLPAGLAFVFVAATVAAAAVWHAIAARTRWVDTPAPAGTADLVAPGALLVAAVLLARDRLTATICWSGDESYHVLRANSFSIDSMAILRDQPLTLVVIPLVAGVLFLLHRQKRPAWTAAAAILGGAGLLGIVWRDGFRLSEFFLPRYPPWSMILESTCATPLLDLSLVEAAHRLPAAIASWGVGIATFRLARRRGLGLAGALLAAGAILTIPALAFHSTLAYVDPLPVCWATLVLARGFDADLREEEDALSIAAMLGLCGLLKETCVPYSLAFLVAGTIAATGLPWRALALRVAKLTTVLFAPYVPQLFLRFVLDTQPLAMDYANFADWEVWRVFLWASSIQLGPAPVLLGAAGWLALRWRSSAWRSFAGLTVAIFWFFMLRIDRLNIGIARYELVFVPLLTVGIVALLEACAAAPRRRWVQALLAAGVVWSIALPSRDRVDRPEWRLRGGHDSDVSYPFDQAVESLEALASGDRVRIDGLDFPYPLDFYLVRAGLSVLHVDQEETAIRPAADAIELARRRGARALLYVHIDPGADPPLPGARRYERDGRVIDVYRLD